MVDLVLTIAAFFIVGVQCIYLSLLLFQLTKHREAVDALPPAPVSVIICAHDEEENLRELLPLLLQQQYPDFEIVVVEDRCNDGTLDYLMSLQHDHPQIKRVEVRHLPAHVNGKKFGLTLGIRAARHEWILLTDADCRPASLQWIATMSKSFAADKQIIAGYSPYLKYPGLLNRFIRFEALMTAIQYAGFTWMGMPYMGVGRNLAYRKSLFLETKGFNSHLNVTGGDDDLFVNENTSQTNTAIATGEDTLVFSKPKLTLREYYVQKIRHLSVGKYYRPMHRFVLGIFQLTWILSWVLVVPLLFLSTCKYWLLGLFVVRWILFIWLISAGSRKLGTSFERWQTPFLEFIYTFYYLVAGTVALVSKKVRWKI